jgi:hypothetical protein
MSPFAFKETKLYGMQDVLDFGQYKGMTIKQVLELNAQYLDWAFYNLSWFDLTSEVVDELNNQDDFKYKDWDD